MVNNDVPAFVMVAAWENSFLTPKVFGWPRGLTGNTKLRSEETGLSCRPKLKSFGPRPRCGG